jgi:hypothetical protein
MNCSKSHAVLRDHSSREWYPPFPWPASDENLTLFASFDSSLIASGPFDYFPTAA